MDARTVRRVERSVELTAAALFGGADGYAVYTLAGAQLPQPIGIAGGLLTFTLAAMLCARLLARVGAEEPRYAVAVFDLHEVEPDRAEDEPSAEEPLELAEPLELDGALELDDVLAEPPPDSRVVRMFAPEAMPAHAGRRPDVHPDGRPIPDAARDLYEALADLRRSLR